MKRTVFFICFFALSLSVFSQVRRRGMQNRIPQTQQEPTEAQIAERERKMEERKQEFLNNFLTTLEADDFQKQIIKQTLESYFEKKIALYKVQYSVSAEREDAVKKLNDAHFDDLKTMISDKDMEKIKAMISGDFDEGEVKKKQRKKEKKKRKKKKDTEG